MPALIDSALRRVDRASAQLGLSSGMQQVLRTCKRAFTVQVPIERQDGSIEVFTGYRVQHNINRGPAKGGLRYHPGTTLDDVRALAMSMTWKCALMRLPFGGAAGAVVCDPRALSLRERERLTRRYASELSIFIGPESDILAPDLNTGSQEMAWIMDTYSVHVGYSVPAVVTGKPPSIGGSEGRSEATGIGIGLILRALAPIVGLTFPACRVAIQGFGEVGAVAAEVLHRAGCRVVAVSDSTGGIFNEAGLDIPGLRSYVRTVGTMHGYRTGEEISNAAVLACPCDVLILAAIENELTADLAATVQAEVILEGANGPITDEADQLLHQRGVTIVPDILAGAGGVTVSYFEWVQGLQETFWTEAEVYQRLESALLEAFAEVQAMRERLSSSYRDAAYMLAVQRVADATDIRGIYP